MLGATGIGFWFHETRWPVRSAEDPPQSLMVAPGDGVRDVGRQLRDLGLVRHPDIFRGLVVSRGGASVEHNSPTATRHSTLRARAA